jgi:uncharacterized membrane protein YesL
MGDERKKRTNRSSNNDNEKKRRFSFFGFGRKDGPGVDPNEEPILKNPNFGNFFVFYFRKFRELLSINLLLVFGNFPIFFFLFSRAGYFGIKSTMPDEWLFAPLFGAYQINPSPVISALYGIYGKQIPIVVNTVGTLVLHYLTYLVIFTFGPVNVGITYLLRNMLRGEPVFFMSDFFQTIKKNLKQAISLGIIDILGLFLLIYDVIFFWNSLNSVMMYIFFYLSLLMLVVFIFMRFYAYLMLVTFDLKIKKIIKNSLIFAILGIKRNIVALVGYIFVFAFNYCALAIYFPIGIILPFVIVPATLMAINVYTAYPKIKEIMIDPYYTEDGKPISDEPASDTQT